MSDRRPVGVGIQAAALLLWVVLLGAVFATVEIQIEGGAG